MKLLTKAIEQQLPPLYGQENVADPIAYLKIFDPCGSWTWYITEYDPVEKLMFGLVYGHEHEMGYISLTELEQVKGRYGLGLERDLSFRPQPLSKCKNPCAA
jgi:hypothetical protein